MEKIQEQIHQVCGYLLANASQVDSPEVLAAARALMKTTLECGQRLTKDQLTVPGYYWWLPADVSGEPEKPENWSIVAWHPQDDSCQMNGVFTGPLLPPVCQREK